ncbi:hypothetical protein [Defluviicoccus vanus]|nr:hypothetical protein [Defluviicoccus vanus]
MQDHPDDDDRDQRPQYGQPRKRPLRVGDRETLERMLEQDEYSPEPLID